MKKVISVFIALLAPFIAFANINTTAQSIDTDDVFCVQVTQAAINTQGECKNFSTPCDVPENWKKVSSCERFKNAKDKSTSIEENTRRRHNNKWAKLRENAKKRLTENKEGSNNQQRIFLRQSKKYVKNNTAREDHTLARKTNTIKNWGSSFRKLVSPVRQKMIDKKKALQDMKENSRAINLRRNVSGSATRMVRSGKLSNKFWSTQRDKRRGNLETSSNAIKQGLRSRQPFRKAKPKRVVKNRHAQLRSTYRGTRSQGSIEGIIQ